jgi:hypothetical protein
MSQIGLPSEDRDTPKPNTLGLWGDGDDIDLIVDIEQSFGLAFPHDEILEWDTVGDIYNDLKSRLNTGNRRAAGCTTATSFRRLRKCLYDFGNFQRISPQTKLADVKVRSVRKLYRQLKARAGLRAPIARLGWMGTLGVIFILSGIAAFFALLALSKFTWLLPALVPVLPGIAMVRFGAWYFPADCKTVGDLSKRIAAFNFRVLTAEDAAVRDSELWAALLEILIEAGPLTKSEIRPETLLMKNQIRAA